MPLVLADEGLIARINQEIATGRVKTSGGQPIDAPIEGGLVREDRQVLYPVVEDIPNMLIEQAIRLDSIELGDDERA